MSCFPDLIIGPTLPIKIKKATMTTSPFDDKVILVGGWDDIERKPSTAMLELSFDAMHWTKLNQTLYHGRQYPLAIKVPYQDSFCGK